MSVRRLVLTGAAMGLVGVALAALTPALADMAGSLAAAQHTVDTAGPDVLLVAAAGLLAWAVWAWGVLGLALTAASALPGIAGDTARLVTHVVLPAGARRSAALLLGLGLGVTAPLITNSTVLAPPAAAAVPAAAVPDWPAATAPGSPVATAPSTPATAPASVPVPDWPGTRSAADEAGSRVVLRGDCLWQIATAWLRERSDRPPTDGEIALAVHDWWTANADVIGPDPDRLLPGQVLRPPGPA